MHHHADPGTFAPGGDAAGLVAALFLMGLAGSFTHCAGMCGPFVLAQVTSGLDRIGAGYGEWARLRGAALLPYHLGRATTYAFLGAVAGAAGGALAALPGFSWVVAACLAVAAALLLIQAWPRLRALVGRPAPATEGGLARALSRASARLLEAPTGPRRFSLGVLLGFLPCGLLYAALAAAAGTAGAGAGALAMAAFALGTVPGLVAVGYAGAMFGRRWREPAGRFAPALLALNAAVLLYLSWRAVA